MSAPSTAQRTRAVGLFAFGEPEVLGVVERVVPSLGPDDVRIRVRAAAVNPSDLIVRGGAVAEALAPFDPPYVPGNDAAGTIEAVGSAVSRLASGDRVMAAVFPIRAGGGAQSEVLVAPAASVVRIPESITFAQAATLPMNGLTALEALDMLAVPEGGTLAITGGTGWLAALAISVAKHRGLTVIADAPAAEQEHVRALGADHVVERGDDIAARIRAIVPGGVDGVLDTALVGPPILAAIRDGGGWVVVRQQQDATERGIVRHNVSVAVRLEDTEALETLAALAASGELPTTVAETFQPEQAAEAHRRQAAGGVRGRLVIVFDQRTDALII
jgi:NADPH:quinone reductase-like Zn-dependent oxidoreductase